MAITTYTNPRYFSGPMLELEESVKAADGATWQAGQPCRRTDSGVVPCLSAATQIAGLFAKSQVTATSTSKVPVYWIPGSSTKFVIGITSGGADAKANPIIVGGNFGLSVNSCIATMSRGCDTDGKAMFHVDNLYCTLEGIKSDTSDTAGKAVVHVLQAFLDAEHDGV
jgi:hypothetical protein